MKKRRFTLLELMAAMVVLVIMMGFLFKFITSSQQLWSASDRNARIYENARILFEVLGRDLTGAVVSKQPGEKIGFWVGDLATANVQHSGEDFLTFATMSPSGDGTDDSNIWEVHYRWGNSSSSTPAALRYLIRRSSVGDQDPEWDFYGDDTTAWIGTTGTAGTSDFEEVIDGVEAVEITCRKADGTYWTVGSQEQQLPAAVRVKLTLVDQQVIDQKLDPAIEVKRLLASRRVFVKAFFLGRN